MTGKVLYRPLCGHWSETAFWEITPVMSPSHQSVASAFDAMEPDVSGVSRGLVRHAIAPTSAFHRLRRRSPLGRRVVPDRPGRSLPSRSPRRSSVGRCGCRAVVADDFELIWQLGTQGNAVTVRRRSERPSPFGRPGQQPDRPTRLLHQDQPHFPQGCGPSR